MQNQPNSHDLYSSMLEAFDAVNLNYFVVEVKLGGDGKPVDIIYRDVNPATERLIGKSRKEILGKTRTELLGKVCDEFPERFFVAIKTGRSVHFQSYGAGLRKYYDVYAWKVADNQVAALVKDITEHRKAEEALRESEQLYRSLFDNTEDGFQLVELIYDLNGQVSDFKFIKVNSAYERQTGLKADFVLGKRAKEFDPNIEQYWLSMYQSVEKTGKAIHKVDYNKNMDKWMDVYTYKFSDGKVGSLFRDITEQKRIELAIKEREALYKTLFEATDDAFQLLEPLADNSGNVFDFKYVTVNSSFERQTGVEAEKVVGKLASKVFPDIESYWLGILTSVLKTGKAKHFEEFNVSTNRWYNQYLFKYKENQIGVLFRDVTERKKAEDSLKEREQLYKTVFDNSQDGFQLIQLIYDEQGRPIDHRFLKVNKAYEKIIGIKSEKFIDKTAKAISPNAESYWFEIPDNVLKTGKTVHIEIYNKDIDKWLDCYYFPYGKDTVGTLFRDVTQRKKTEQALASSEERYKDLFNSMNEMFQVIELVYDDIGQAVDFYYREVNPASWRLGNLSREQMIGKRVKELFGTVERYWLESLSQVNKTGKSKQLENYSAAIDKYYDVYIWKVKKVENTVALIFSDISERKKLEKELHEKEKLATIGQTAGMVGHDIRNPLQAMISDIYLLKSELTAMPECQTKEGVKESLEDIENNIAYVNKIVGDLQDYTRPLKPNRVLIKVDDKIRNALKNVRIPETVRLHVCVQPGLVIESDADYLRRALTNLINNAVQAMPDGGDLTIEVKAQNGKVLFGVQDTGVGIPDDVKPNLFKPLFTTKSKGQGLGLAVVKRLVEALNGTISFESQAGKGTKFIIELPVNQ